MKVVLDTNVLLVSIPSKSKYHNIYKAFINNKFELIISNEIITEYTEIISRKANEFVAKNIIETIIFSKNITFQNIYFNFNLIDLDPDDNKFVDCAITSSADFIVTNDRHFNILKSIPFPKVHIISIDEFLRILG